MFDLKSLAVVGLAMSIIDPLAREDITCLGPCGPWQNTTQC